MMDKPQREVQGELLREEREVKKKLRANYCAALTDVKKWLRKLTEDPDIVSDNIHHDKYQRMLEAQLTELLAELGERNVSVTDDYLREAYQEAYLGCLYRMHHDGVNLVVQIDPDRVERAVRRKTKDLQFSARLYQNVDQLKEETKAEIARGFSTGQDYLWMAARISQRAGIAYGNACRIARTEGHRIANESDMDAMRDAASAGADVVKEWNSMLDDVTRSTHRELDGQIRELDEPFEIPSTGSRAMYPGGFGAAKEDIHCRCCMNQRARWALDSERYKYSRERGAIVSINSNVYKEWKEKYTDVVRKQIASTHGIEEHDFPKYLGRVDVTNWNEVDRAVRSFEETNRNGNTERALVIMADGCIYECYGTEQSVYPDVDLGDRIKGAIVITHNHPADYTEYALSKQDCALFENYGLQVLRGVDEKYTYELTRLDDVVDDPINIFEMQEETDARNEEMKDWALQRGYGYTRRRLDD